MKDETIFKHAILSGGYYYKSLDGGKGFCDAMRDCVGKDDIIILDCLFAREIGGDERFLIDCEFFKKFLPHSIIIKAGDDFCDQSKKADVIFFQGGSVRLLVERLKNIEGLYESFRNKVIAGSSAGADALCTYYGVVKKMRVGEGLGIVPIKLIPHCYSTEPDFINADYETLKNDLMNYKEDLPIVCLSDGEFKVF